MARFEAVNVDQLNEDLTNIADTIKEKSGITSKLNFPLDFIQAINDIPTDSEASAEIIKKSKTHDWMQQHNINHRKTIQNNLFANNSNITEIPEFDFSQVINFYRMFYNCSGLTKIHSIDTSNGENFGEMFRGCTSLLEIPPLNTSKGTDMNKMFNNFKGRALSWVINTDNVTNFEAMFDSASNIEEINLTSTANGTTFYRAFIYCGNLKKISTLDLSNCTNTERMFEGCYKLENISFVLKTIKISISIPSANLTNESIQSVIDGLATVETAQTLTLHANLKILQSQVDSANAKGWTVAGGTIVSEEEYYG